MLKCSMDGGFSDPVFFQFFIKGAPADSQAGSRRCFIPVASLQYFTDQLGFVFDDGLSRFGNVQFIDVGFNHRRWEVASLNL